MFEQVRAIFFDLDDTLCGYWTAANVALRRAFEAHVEHGRTPDQMIQHWAEEFRTFGSEISGTAWYAQYCRNGETTRTELMRRTLERIGIFDRQLALDIGMTYAVERQAALILFDEVIHVLDALHGRYKLGLITNGPADVQREEIEKLGVGHYFDPILIEGEMLMGKPNPAVMRRGQELMACTADEILMVGNSYRHDLQPAIRAGWRSAWVRRATDVPMSSRTGKPEELPEGSPEPDLTITSLAELLLHLPLAGSGRTG